MTLEDLKDELELWKTAWPKYIYGAMSKSLNKTRKEIKQGYAMHNTVNASHKPGYKHLSDSVKVKVSLDPLSAKIFVSGGVQYKAQAMEYGNIISASKSKYLVFEGAWGEVKKVKSVTIPARPVFDPIVQARERDMLDEIHNTLVEGFENGTIRNK